MNKKLPLVSVVIPVYNEEKYLSHCLSSLTEQTYRETEVIVVDDGSTDSSVEIAREFKTRIISQPHKGAGRARNTGAAAALGEILVFADADMRYDKNYLFYLVAPILKKKVIGTFVKEELVANDDNIWSRCWSINSGLPFGRRLPSDYSQTANGFRAIKKSYFDRVGGYDVSEGYMDDGSLGRKLKTHAQNASGAISYHYNPSSLHEVFFSARWIGRSISFGKNIQNALRYSPINSIRVSMKYIISGAPLAIIPFKLIYDFGMLVGIFLRGESNAK